MWTQIYNKVEYKQKSRIQSFLKHKKNCGKKEGPVRVPLFITAETIAIYWKLNLELDALAFDAEKAFDTVNHDTMLTVISCTKMES